MQSPGDIRILEIRTLRGPNRWTYRPVIEALVDIGELEDFPSNLLPGFPERLASWLPGLIEHRCSYGERGGFLRRLADGTWPGHILEHVTLELQTLAGLPTGFGKARETSRRGVYKVVVRAWHEDVARTALQEARLLMLAAIEDRPYDVAGTVRSLRRMVDRLCLGPSTGCIVDAADDRDIPTIRLNDGNLVQMGYGANQRRIWTAETDRTSAIAESISRDKDLTKQLLAPVGVPVPEGEYVRSAAQARQIAESIGYPVVVKPYDGNHGRGVFTNLVTGDEVEAAYDIALDEGSGVIVERFIQGSEHRLLVVAGKLVAAARGDLASVTGDGQSSIEQLIDRQLNADPRRGSTEDTPLNPVRLDSASRLELSRQGLSAESVLAAGREVLIQRNGNVAIDCTADVHPSTAALASLAARTIGLDIAGIDLVAEDISRPLAEQRGAIVEVNAGPGLLMHLRPAEGKPQPVGPAIVDHLFPQGESGRIPVVGITGSRHTGAIALAVENLAAQLGHKVASATSAGLTLDGRLVQSGNCANYDAGRRTLLSRSIDFAVIENGARSIAEDGLAYDRCLIGVVTSFDPSETLDDLYIETPEGMYGVYRSQVDVVLSEGTAVLNGDDEQVADMASLSDGEVIFYGRDPASAAIEAHLAKGGRAVFPRGHHVILASGNTETVLPSLLTSSTDLDVLLPAAAVGWSLSMSPELLRTSLEKPLLQTPVCQPAVVRTTVAMSA
jgi:cyanophycin synthetase